ncbi:MAG: C-OmpA-like family protein CmpA [Tatlockia sp.]
MSRKGFIGQLVMICLLSVALSGCFHPPYNRFKPYRRVYTTTGPGAAIGTVAVAVAGGAPILAGAVLGGAVGAAVGAYKDSKPALIKVLKKRFQIDYIEYGETVTIIVPTDRYYLFNSAKLNEICFAGLAELIKLIKLFPRCCPIYVAGFTDNVGSRFSKKLMSQAKAETMVSFLWAHGIPSRRLVAEGYGEKNPVGDNQLMHGSAYNRRIEIQILLSCSNARAEPVLFSGMNK